MDYWLAAIVWSLSAVSDANGSKYGLYALDYGKILFNRNVQPYGMDLRIYVIDKNTRIDKKYVSLTL